MFISPIQFGSIVSPCVTQPIQQKNNSFFDEFMGAVNQAKEAEKQAAEDSYKLAIGEADNLHEITINSAKAELSLQLMVQLRNKMLDSYNEVMRMGV